MEVLHDVGPADDEVLVAPLELESSEVIGREVAQLKVGARSSVVDDHPLGDGLEIRLGGHGRTRLPAHAFALAASNLHVPMGRERIYTKKGDDGTTGLFYGGRVRKYDLLPEAYGAVDEAQAVMGVARSRARRGSQVDDLLVDLERDLYVLMAELA